MRVPESEPRSWPCAGLDKSTSRLARSPNSRRSRSAALRSPIPSLASASWRQRARILDFEQQRAITQLAVDPEHTPAGQLRNPVLDGVLHDGLQQHDRDSHPARVGG